MPLLAIAIYLEKVTRGLGRCIQKCSFHGTTYNDDIEIGKGR